ncbi:MAG: dihydroorotase [Candidatus Gracilibacteria bacterium]|nr:dihydroorotase [Candidatus Gracilibacteria bacterium]
MSLHILQPFDAHLHLRTGNMAELVTPMSAAQFADVIVMPNLNPPITTVDHAISYRNYLLEIAKCNYHMAIYLTESTTVEEIQLAAKNPFIIGYKLYPLNATTGSQSGISDIKKVYPLFEKMEKLKVPLLVHGEVTRSDVDIFDREKVFIEEILTDIVQKFPKLRITLEHITTAEAVEFVLSNENVVASITAHHLLINRNAIFTVDEKTALNPHNFCLPVAKTERDRNILIKAATSGNPKFFAGTDSAPHPLSRKESSCGCAGCFTGLHALELYATAFYQFGKLAKLEDFLSIFGRLHYGLEIPSNDYITLGYEKYLIPEKLGEENLVPFMYGQILNWKIIGE